MWFVGPIKFMQNYVYVSMSYFKGVYGRFRIHGFRKGLRLWLGLVNIHFLTLVSFFGVIGSNN